MTAADHVCETCGAPAPFSEGPPLEDRDRHYYCLEHWQKKIVVSEPPPSLGGEQRKLL